MDRRRESAVEEETDEVSIHVSVDETGNSTAEQLEGIYDSLYRASDCWV